MTLFVDQELSISNDELDRCYNFTKSLQLNLDRSLRVALQLPDSWFSVAVNLCHVLSQMFVSSNPQPCFFILADTAYGACCVDDVAAQHGDADCLIHFGPACLSRTARLPVLYVFGQAFLDVSMLVELIHKNLDRSDHVLVIYDVMYHYAMDELRRLLNSHENLVIAETLTESHMSQTIKSDRECCGNTCQSKDESNVPIVTDLSQLSIEDDVHNVWCESGRTFRLKAPLESYNVLFIGSPSLCLNHWQLVTSQHRFITFDPTSNEWQDADTNQVHKTMRRRYALVQKARDADVIGIIVGTLGVEKYMTVVRDLMKRISDAGKRYYVYAMGKINAAKLANFGEVDAYVLVSCAQNSLLDDKNFYRPVVTPYELTLALRVDCLWSAKYVADFDAYLLNAARDDLITSEVDMDAPIFSLATGKLKQSMAQQIQEAVAQDPTKELVHLGAQQLALFQQSPAAVTLQKRIYRGLEMEASESRSNVVEQGRSGRAFGYNEA